LSSSRAVRKDGYRHKAPVFDGGFFVGDSLSHCEAEAQQYRYISLSDLTLNTYHSEMTDRIVAAMNSIQDKRARILAAGTTAMLRKGYNGTGVQEITRSAGVP